MLVLSRKPSETIRIGDDISLCVIAIEGNSAKIGVDAPPHISVHRGEVYKRIQEENRMAARRLSAGLHTFTKAFRRKNPAHAAHPTPTDQKR